MKHGGKLAAKYDPSTVTHIVTEARSKTTAEKLGIKHIDEIPLQIPTVKWSWLEAGAAKPIRRAPVEPGAAPGTLGEQLPVDLPPTLHHTAFLDRDRALFYHSKGKKRANDPDISRIS